MNFVEQKCKRKQKRVPKKTVLKSVLQVHQEKMEYFENLQLVVLPKLQKSKKLDQKKIDEIISRKEENEYHLDTAHIISEFIEEDIMLDRKTLLTADYFNAINLERPILECNKQRESNEFDCGKCGSENIETSEGIVCPNCGHQTSSVFITDIPSYKESQEYERKVVIDYKRINYFTEWLNQIQAKEHTEIPSEVTDSIILELKKEKISDMKRLNPSFVKRLLKKCGHSKFYEHIPLIINTFNGVKPLTMPVSVENKLKFMFNEIQIPWELCKPDNRNNFFSYPYILYKFCQLLEMHEFLPYFPLLKSREKLYIQDTIWKKIVEMLSKRTEEYKLFDIDWKFIPSV